MAKREQLGILLPSLYGGGAERAAIRLGTQLMGDYDVHIIAMESGKDYEIPKGMQFRQLTQVDGRSSPWKKLFAGPLQALRLRKYLKQLAFGVLITFTERPSAIGALAAMGLSRVRLIMSFRNYQSDHLDAEKMHPAAKKIRNSVYKFMIRRANFFADALNVLSEGAKIDLIENFGLPPDRVHTIFNEYDIDDLSRQAREPVPAPLSPLLEGPVVITAGRLSKQKGQRHLINAFVGVLQNVPKARLIILGVGPLGEELRALSKSLDLPTYELADAVGGQTGPGVYFLGFQKGPLALIRRARVFAFPSLWEGFGNALIEAMACETPVISADCRAGPRELLAPSTHPLAKTAKEEIADYGILMPSFLEDSSIDDIKRFEQMWTVSLTRLLRDESEAKALGKKAFAGASRFRINRSRDLWRTLIDSTAK